MLKGKYNSTKMKREKADCISCTNENCLIKKHIYSEYIQSIINQKNTFTCKKSQQFILEGSPIHGLFFIFKGKAKVTKTGISGREQIVRFANDGDVIGHRGFGTESNYPIGATALEDSILCNFSSNLLIEVLHKAPDLTFDLMMFYASELNRSETKVKKLAQMTVREKVIDALINIYNVFGQEKDFFSITLPRKDIADFAGTTEEQVIRTISGLKKEGLIQTEGKKIGILNIDKLKKEIDEHNYFSTS